MHCSSESTSSRISLKLGIAALFALTLMLNASASPAQAAYLPSVQIGTAALISTTTADSYYGSSTTSTNGPGAPTVRPPELVELARALKNNPDLIYEYVRNNIEVVWECGLQKGALGASIDKSGTPFDQAALMVELLRQSGYTATYLAGTITLSGADFYSWTGINDTHAACQLLANGGLAGSVNGSTSMLCASGAGSALTSVTLSHVWVQVTINGTNYVFDPSFKPHTWKSGINLSSATGLVSGQALSQATSGMDSGTLSGVSYVHQLNASALNSKLQTYSSNLLSYLQSHNLAAAQIEDVVSGSVITPYISPPGGLRQTQLPYQGSAIAHTWTGNVPDQYRTTLQVQGYVWNYNDVPPAYETMFDLTFYVDQIYGRALRIDTDYGPVMQDKYANKISLTLDGATLATYTNPGINTGGSTPASSRGAPAYITLTANHPYASSADGTVTAHGDYMDATLTKTVSLISSLTIVHAWGDTSGDLFAKWTDERAGDKSLPPSAAQCPPPNDGFCGETYLGSQGDFDREKMAANWLAQYTRAAHLHAAIAGSVVQLHHVLGAVYGDGRLSPSYPFGYQTPIVTFPQVDNFNRIDVDAALSLASKTADAVARRAAVQGIAASAATLEGSVTAQMDGLPDTASTATRFEWGNTPPGTAGNSDPTYEDPSGVGPRKFLQFTSANASAAAGLVLAEGQATNSNDGQADWGSQPELGASEAANWENALTTTITNYANAGFTVVASQESFLGPGQRAGTISDAVIQNGIVLTYFHAPTKQRGGAVVATRYDSNGDPVEIAHLVLALLSRGDGSGYDTTKGGGGGGEPSQTTNYNPSEAADVLKSRFVDRSNALGINLANGSLAFTSPAKLDVGNGGFPYELSSEFSWHPGPPPSTDKPIIPTQPPTGWTNNWQNSLSMSGSGPEAMGKTDVRASVNTIAAFLAVQDIYKAAQSPQRDVAAVLSQAWWAHQLSSNVATVALGGSTQQFLESTPGQWIAPGAGSFAQLAATGSRVAYEQICQPHFGQKAPYALARGWDDSALSFTATNAHGDVQNFAYWTNQYSTNDFDICGKLQGFRLASWSFPQGVSVNLTYAVPAGSGDPIDALTKVTNSLGREIDFGYPALTSIGSMTDAANTARVVNVTLADDETTIASHTDPAGAVTAFAYTPAMGASATQRPVPYQELNKVFTADNASVANVQYDYDTLGRINQVEDAEHLQVGDRNPYQFYLADGTRGERDDPLGGAYAVVYDTYKHPARYLDELGRETDAQFDGRGRPIQYVYPEGDCEVFGYDDHNNTTNYTKVDKTSACNVNAGATHVLTASAVWDQTWNKPTSITNALGKVTTLAYYASGTGASLLHTATRPDPDGAGGNPALSYSFVYNSTGKLLTATDPVSVTTNAYDGSGNLTSTIADSGTGHFNLTTLYGYDADGNVTTTTDPRSNVTSSLYDLDRRKTQDLHHDGNVSATLNAATRTTYDAVGRVIMTEAGTAFTGVNVTAWVTTDTKTYTPTGRLATDKDGDNRTTTTAYDGDDHVLTVTDPVSRATHFVYDAAGETQIEIRGFNSTLQENYASYTYTPNGKQQSVKDANTNETDFAYDGFDRLATTTFPDGTTEQIPASGGYDANGNVLKRINRSNQTLTFTYDNLDRMTTKVSPSPALTVTWTYLANGLLSKICDATNCGASGNVIAYGYDTAGRLSSAATTLAGLSGAKTISYTLDANGNRTNLLWPDGYSVTYAYDSLNRMASAVNGATTLAAYSYNPLSQRTNLAYNNSTGATVAYTWSTAGDLLTLAHNFSGTTNDVTYTETYTNAHQLATETISDTDYRFAPGANGTVAYASANNLNQYPSVGGQTLSYDTRGNLTGDGTWTYSYDAENRLLTASKTGTNATFAYDPLGRRVKKSTGGANTTYYLSDGSNEIAEYTGSGAGTLQYRYVPGPAIDEPIAMVKVTAPAATTYFHENKTGSVVAMSGSTSALTEGPYTYDAYGAVSATTGVAFKFTGRRLDPETGLYYYRARYYSPAWGRFLQTDSVGYGSDLDLYTYAGNDPTDKADPTGEIINCVGSGDNQMCTVTANSATGNAKNLPVTNRDPGAESYGKSVISNLRSNNGEKSAYISKDDKGNYQQKMTGTDTPTETGWKTSSLAGPGIVTQHSHGEKAGDIAPGIQSKKLNDSSVIQKGGTSQIFNRDRVGTLSVGPGGVVTYEIQGHATPQELNETQHNVNTFQTIMEDIFTPEPPPR